MVCFVDDPLLSKKYRDHLLLFSVKIKNDKYCSDCQKNNKQMSMADCKLFQEKDLSNIGFPSNFIFTKTG